MVSTAQHFHLVGRAHCSNKTHTLPLRAPNLVAGVFLNAAPQFFLGQRQIKSQSNDLLVTGAANRSRSMSDEYEVCPDILDIATKPAFFGCYDAQK